MLVESARSKAFVHFDRGLRPAELPDLEVKKETVWRYFQDWKKLHSGEGWLQKALPGSARQVKHRRVNDTPGWLIQRMAQGGKEVEAAFFRKLYRTVPRFRRAIEKAHKEARAKGEQLVDEATWPTSLTPHEIDRWFFIAEVAKSRGELEELIATLESALTATHRRPGDRGTKR